MNIKGFFLQGAMAAVLLFGAVTAQAGSAGAAYTMTNAPDDNQIVVFSRDAQGLLTKTDVVSTGGKGSGGDVDPLASQGSLVLSQHGQWLLAVNAESNDISVFRVRPGGIKLRDRTGSGGTLPVSVTISGDRVYVLNNGVPANITGFKLDHRGHLHALTHSTRLLGAGSYGQVAFDPRGKSLTVVDKANDRILVFPLRKHGLPAAAPVISPSSGNVPFGVAFDRRGHLLVVEAGSNAVSSYRMLHNGSLQTISASVANGQAATCWIAVNHRGDVFTTNPGTHSLSAFHVAAATGQVSLLNGTAGAGDAPLDIDITRNGRFAYAVDPANGGVDMFKIGHDGSLTGMGSVPAGLAIYAQGMAVR